MDRSDESSRILLDVRTEFQPERASAVGIESADERTLDLAEGFRARNVAALEAARKKLEARRATETDPLIAISVAPGSFFSAVTASTKSPFSCSVLRQVNWRS